MSNTDLSMTETVVKPVIKGRCQDSSFKSDSITSGSARRVESGRRVGGGESRVRRVRGNNERRQSSGFSKNIPSGKWRNDKFADNENGASPAPKGAIVGANKKVRLNIANLAPTVTREDLQELFSSFSVDSVAVHYDENGQHLGTGNVVMKKENAEKAVKEFKGVSIDGSRLILSIVDGSSTNLRPISDRVTGMKRMTRVGGGKVQKRSHGTTARPLRRLGSNKPSGRNSLRRNNENSKPKGGRGRGGKKEKKPQTEAELDAELESYMKKNEEMEA